MAQSTGASRYNQPVKYGKSLVITMADGSTKTLAGLPAKVFQDSLENNPRIISIVTNEETGETEFYNLSDSGCGYCKVAVLTPSAASTDPVACENGLPNCADSELDPTTPSLSLSNYYVEVEVGKEYKVVASVVPAGTAVTWASNATGTATVADGVIKGVAEGDTTVTVKAGDITNTINVRVAAEGALTDKITGGSTARP